MRYLLLVLLLAGCSLPNDRFNATYGCRRTLIYLLNEDLLKPKFFMKPGVKRKVLAFCNDLGMNDE